jgi:hypothetical protein
MARHSGSLRTASAGSITLPSAALAASASNGFVLREVAVFNTTITACLYKLVRLSTAGTPGAAATEAEWDLDGPAPTATLAGVYTSTAPTTTELGIVFPLGAAIGSGVVRTFGGSGIRCPVGVANGIGVMLATGTGQILDIDVTWDEGG